MQAGRSTAPHGNDPDNGVIINRCPYTQPMKRTTIFLGEADRTAIQSIKDQFGISSDSDAIRLALRVIAGVPNPHVLLLPRTQHVANDEHERAA